MVRNRVVRTMDDQGVRHTPHDGHRYDGASGHHHPAVPETGGAA
jgi:hypothetical protein